MSEDEIVSTAVLAEDAAVRARNLILALHRHGESLGIMTIADAVADGARRGVTTTVPGLLPPTISRAEADRYAASAASGAVASTLAFLADCPIGKVGQLSTSGVKQDETTMVAVRAKTTSSGSSSLVRHSILAFLVVMAVVSIFAIVLRAV